MEVIAIEQKIFEKMQEDLSLLHSEIKNIAQRYKSADSLRKWLDTQDVCLILNVGKRTLQAYKKSRLLGYTRINRKNYYRIDDVLQLIKNLKSSVL